MLNDIFLGDGLKKAWPTCAGIEFRIGCKKREPAADAGIDARFMVVEQVSTERLFGPSGAGDLILLGRELFFPFFIAFDDARGIDQHQVSGLIEYSNFHGSERAIDV